MVMFHMKVCLLQKNMVVALIVEKILDGYWKRILKLCSFMVLEKCEVHNTGIRMHQYFNQYLLIME